MRCLFLWPSVSFCSKRVLALQRPRDDVPHLLSLTKTFSKLLLPIPQWPQTELQLGEGGVDSHMKMVGNYSSQCITKKLLFDGALKTL